MIIITWNANAVDRWNQLWNDPLVVNLSWDVICLQEVGNPRPEWHQISGKPWGAKTIKEHLIRKYWFTTPFGLTVYITHCEWTHRQKNHLAMVTRALPSFAKDVSGAMGERPCLGINVQLHFQFPQPHKIKLLIGCVHLIATSSKAPAETRAMLQFVDSMTEVRKLQGWLLVGDFNAAPQSVAQATNCFAFAPPSWTQKNQLNYPLDYILASNREIIGSSATHWRVGDAKSDHRLVGFYQLNGPQVEIL